jgi:type VI secretion system secreted protein VgrG
VKVVRVLWHHVERLEHALSAAENHVTLTTGDASITMKADGNIEIKGKDVTVQGTGRVNLKAAGNLSLKGAKIEQN